VVDRPRAVEQRLWTSDGWPIIRATDDVAEHSAYWAAACAQDVGLPTTPEVRFYNAPPNVRCGYVSRSVPGVVFVRHGMSLSDTRRTIAHECAHLAGADEPAARWYERDRSRDSWWYRPPERREPTADE
jgi:hypothetical protein